MLLRKLKIPESPKFVSWIDSKLEEESLKLKTEDVTIVFAKFVAKFW